MNEYHKIQSVWKRDPGNMRHLLEGEWATPEFEALRSVDWDVEEKVDGTNIRVIIDESGIRYGGKTDRASIPTPLLQALRDLFEPQVEALREQFPDGACLYGEGYGAKIQKVGGLYRPDQSFVLFDVRVGKWWLDRPAVTDIAKTFGIERVPVVGLMTLDNAIERVRDGFQSSWGDFEAEGVIARAPHGIQTRSGERIITKIKHRDFP